MSSPIDGLIAALASNLKLSNAVAAATSAEEADKIAENPGYKVGTNELLNAYKNEIMELSGALTLHSTPDSSANFTRAGAAWSTHPDL